MNSKLILGPMRVPFLILTPICVLLGISTAVYLKKNIDVLNLLLVFIGALAAHISVNALNEYDDFKSGLDFKTQPTPFSGGSKTLPNAPSKAFIALWIGIISLLVVIFIGIYFLFTRGLLLLPVGILGIIIIILYTRWITKNHILCLISPGTGFGLLMVLGTHFVLTKSYSMTSFIASLVPFFLVNNLLLLNQFPDVVPDKEVGRRHFPIVIGRKKSALIFNFFLLCSYISIIIGCVFGYFPLISLLSFISIIIAIPLARGAVKYADDIPKLVPYLTINVILILLLPLLLSITLFIA